MRTVSPWWGTTKLDEFDALEFQTWLKELKVAGKTKGHLKAFMNRLFNKARLYKMLYFLENPIGLVEVRGISKRRRKPADLTVDQFSLICRRPIAACHWWTSALDSVWTNCWRFGG